MLKKRSKAANVYPAVESFGNVSTSGFVRLVMIAGLSTTGHRSIQRRPWKNAANNIAERKGVLVRQFLSLKELLHPCAPKRSAVSDPAVYPSQFPTASR